MSEEKPVDTRCTVPSKASTFRGPQAIMALHRWGEAVVLNCETLMDVRPTWSLPEPTYPNVPRSAGVVSEYFIDFTFEPDQSDPRQGERLRQAVPLTVTFTCSDCGLIMKWSGFNLLKFVCRSSDRIGGLVQQFSRKDAV